ncbi:metallopeptidase family protein [Rhodobacteraceae bacterium KMM 6894]|nr:metallopeptidase family protein [Rhodobacteraceae bacterium KMM 6894]
MTLPDPQSLDAIETMARTAIAAFPAPFNALAAPVLLRVEDWPEKTMLRDLNIDDPLDLTGLYEGIPLTEKSVSNPAPWPDIVWLFRRPILDELSTRDGITLEQLVTHVTVHEFAHHFGWSDADIATIDRWWE